MRHISDVTDLAIIHIYDSDEYKEGSIMNVNAAAKRISDFLDLKLNIQAVKLIEDPAQVPENALNAHKEYGHLSLCQAFALTKRNGKTLYTDKSSEWCWAPVVGLGYAPTGPDTECFHEISRLLGIQDQEQADRFFEAFPRLPVGKYQGVLLAPAQSAEFEPDVLLVNCDNNFQLRTLLGAIKFKTGKLLDVHLDPVDSCVHTLVAAMISKDYTVAFPDPGDQERALSDSNEVIMAVPVEKLPDLLEGMDFLETWHMAYKDFRKEMMFDFTRPPFYNTVFKSWGMDQGEDWDGHK